MAKRLKRQQEEEEGQTRSSVYRDRAAERRVEGTDLEENKTGGLEAEIERLRNLTAARDAPRAAEIPDFSAVNAVIERLYGSKPQEFTGWLIDCEGNTPITKVITKTSMAPGFRLSDSDVQLVSGMNFIQPNHENPASAVEEEEEDFDMFAPPPTTATMPTMQQLADMLHRVEDAIELKLNQ